tara:strand:+ start:2965 stop:3378 length:414 start_codon:yes stop_codon:yes gene_type:complete
MYYFVYLKRIPVIINSPIMRKSILSIIALFFVMVSFAQQEKELKHNKETNLVEATYYHDNGVISQKGTFDLAGKLHGEWTSYDQSGEKLSAGTYNKGVRTGKWFFWTEGNLKEVAFSDNMIASVIDKERKSSVVTKE